MFQDTLPPTAISLPALLSKHEVFSDKTSKETFVEPASLVPGFIHETTRLSQTCEDATRGLDQAEEKLSELGVRLAMVNFGVLAIKGPHQNELLLGSLDREE